MKPMRSIILPGLFCLSMCITQAEESTSRIPRKPPTHADLVKKKADHAEKKVVEIATSKKPLVTTKKRSLIANSTLLASGDYWTLVPRGSVIHVPNHYRSKIVTKPTGQLLEWKHFLRKNKGWLQTLPVTMKQAQGKIKMDEKSKKAYQSIGKVVVSTCANGPITLAKEPVKPAATNTRK